MDYPGDDFNLSVQETFICRDPQHLLQNMSNALIGQLLILVLWLNNQPILSLDIPYPVCLFDHESNDDVDRMHALVHQLQETRLSIPEVSEFSPASKYVLIAPIMDSLIEAINALKCREFAEMLVPVVERIFEIKTRFISLSQ